MGKLSRQHRHQNIVFCCDDTYYRPVAIISTRAFFIVFLLVELFKYESDKLRIRGTAKNPNANPCSGKWITM